MRRPEDHLPDVRDGLTRVERIVLVCLHEAQREGGGRDVPTAMLYGRVVEHAVERLPGDACACTSNVPLAPAPLMPT